MSERNNPKESDPKQSSLSLYDGVGEEDLVDEEIDERILKIIGLDGVYDIDYGTYLSNLKEKLVAISIGDKELAREEQILLQDEFKRVKGKVGRFTIKKKKITAENIGVTGPIRVSTDKFYLTSKAIIPQPEATTQEESSKDVKDISEALDALIKSITEQNKQERKKSEQSRKIDEQNKRAKSEASLEKPLQKAVGLVKKLVAPFQSILDRIMKFIQFTFIGFLIDKVLKWFADPKNDKKVKILGRFLKDWWPSLLGAFVLFATPFGAFVRGTLKLLRGFIPQIAKLIPQIAKLIPANPATAAAVGIGAAMTAATIVGNKQKSANEEILFPEKDKDGKPIKKTPQQRVSETQKKANMQLANPMGAGPIGSTFSGGGRVKRNSFFGGKEVNVNDIAFNEGGDIGDDSGMRITGAGPDTQLIAAQPGEVVMSKKAVDKHGANFFLGLNKKAGGTNIPKMVNNIQLAQGGGMVGKSGMSGLSGGGRFAQTPGGGFGRGGFLDTLGRFLPNTGTVMAPRTSGPRDIKGNQQTDPRFQSKFLGIPLGSPTSGASSGFGMTAPLGPGGGVGGYTKEQKERYASRTGSSFVPTSYAGSNIMDRHMRFPGFPSLQNKKTEIPDYMMPANTSKSQQPKSDPKKENDKFIGESFRDFGKNLKALTNYNKKQEEDMREKGVKPDGYVNIFGKKILGPQSKAQPVGTPTIISRSQTIVMPTQRMGGKTSPPIKTGTQIPDIQTVASIPHREMVIQSLGIGDLMGVG